MCFQKSLLRRVQVGAMKGCSARHTTHRKNLKLDSFARQIGIGFVPINLRFHAPGVTLWNTRFSHQQAQRNFACVHVFADRPFRYFAV